MPKTNVFLSSHTTEVEGVAHRLLEYLNQYGYTVSLIFDPLEASRQRYTKIKVRNRTIIIPRPRLGFLDYIGDSLVTVIALLFSSPLDIYVGMSAMDCLSALLFRYKIKKLILYASDFSANRFGSSFLNALYLQIEKLILKRADLVISNTDAAEVARKELGLDPSRSQVIPNGVDTTISKQLTHHFPIVPWYILAI